MVIKLKDMKNIHILPTEKPSILYGKDDNYKLANSTMAMDWYISSVGYKPYNLYITSDEKINYDDEQWLLVFGEYETYVDYHNEPTTYYNDHKKIILTTDQDLIKDGVQSIDDVFLEWFVKNPSCEFVEVEDWYSIFLSCCKSKEECYCNKKRIIIPKEEPIQDKKIYSEEEVRKISLDFFYHWWNAKGSNTEQGFDKWFEQVKKK